SRLCGAARSWPEARNEASQDIVWPPSTVDDSRLPAHRRAPRFAREGPRVSLVLEPGAGRPTDPLIEIYLERRENLVRFFAARTGSLAVAEDLPRGPYVKIATRDQAVTAENPVALIYRIATNVMLDRARGEARAVARDTAWRRVAHDSLGGIDVAE